MSSKTKISQAEELERQYNDYKANFEQWKEKNKDSVGTDAYIRYVRQFEDWERDVEKRRAALRHAAEQDAEKARLEAEAKRIEQEIQRRNDEAAARAYADEQASYLAMHQQAIQDEQQAAASNRARLLAGAGGGALGQGQQQQSQQYSPSLIIQQHQQQIQAQFQQQTQTQQRQFGSTVSSTSVSMIASEQQLQLQHHQKQQLYASSPTLTPGQQSSQGRTPGQQQFTSSPLISSSTIGGVQQQATAVTPASQDGGGGGGSTGAAPATGVGADSMMNVMQQVLSFVMDGGQPKPGAPSAEQQKQQKISSVPFPLPLEIAPPQEQAGAPPQLWGAEGAAYPPTDPLFRRWNVRAAPPNFRVPYQPPPPGAMTTPGWFMLKKLKEEKLAIFAPGATGGPPPGAGPGMGGGAGAPLPGALPPQQPGGLGMAGPPGMPPPLPIHLQQPQHPPPGALSGVSGFGSGGGPSFPSLLSQTPGPWHHGGTLGGPPPQGHLMGPGGAGPGGFPPAPLHQQQQQFHVKSHWGEA